MYTKEQLSALKYGEIIEISKNLGVYKSKSKKIYLINKILKSQEIDNSDDKENEINIGQLLPTESEDRRETFIIETPSDVQNASKGYQRKKRAQSKNKKASKLTIAKDISPVPEIVGNDRRTTFIVEEIPPLNKKHIGTICENASENFEFDIPENRDNDRRSTFIVGETPVAQKKLETVSEEDDEVIKKKGKTIKKSYKCQNDCVNRRVSTRIMKKTLLAIENVILPHKRYTNQFSQMKTIPKDIEFKLSHLMSNIVENNIPKKNLRSNVKNYCQNQKDGINFFMKTDKLSKECSESQMESTQDVIDQKENVDPKEKVEDEENIEEEEEEKPMSLPEDIGNENEKSTRGSTSSDDAHKKIPATPKTSIDLNSIKSFTPLYEDAVDTNKNRCCESEDSTQNLIGPKENMGAEENVENLEKPKTPEESLENVNVHNNKPKNKTRPFKKNQDNIPLVNVKKRTRKIKVSRFFNMSGVEASPLKKGQEIKMVREGTFDLSESEKSTRGNKSTSDDVPKQVPATPKRSTWDLSSIKNFTPKCQEENVENMSVFDRLHANITLSGRRSRQVETPKKETPFKIKAGTPFQMNRRSTRTSIKCETPKDKKRQLLLMKAAKLTVRRPSEAPKTCFSASKIPDFNRLHQKNCQKMESIVDNKLRIMNRAKSFMTPVKKVPGSSSKTPAVKKSLIPIKSNIESCTEAIKKTRSSNLAETRAREKKSLVGVRTNKRFELQMKFRNSCNK